jgi:hypothetical protein
MGTQKGRKSGLGIPLPCDVVAYVLPDDIIIKNPGGRNVEMGNGINGLSAATAFSSIFACFTN